MQKGFAIKTAMAAGIWASLTFGAFAGPQYVDETGYASSGYDVVAFQSLKKGEAAVPGKASITAEWNGSKWAFATEENKQAFWPIRPNMRLSTMAIAPMALQKAAKCRATRTFGPL